MRILSFYSFMLVLCLPACSWWGDSYVITKQQQSAWQQVAYDMYVDFDTAMDLRSGAYVAVRDQSFKLYSMFKQLYERNSFAKVAVSNTLKIPKVFHHIWLGSKLPKKYEAFLHSWYKLHPEWTFVFWTDNQQNYEYGTQVVSSFDEVQALVDKHTPQKIVVDVTRLQFGNKPFFDSATNYGEKSDILRWDIVHRLGGTYVDTDYECLRALDMLHYMYDFYTGMQPLDTGMVQLGAGLFGARPGHPILERTVNTLKNNAHITQIIVKTGPVHFTRSFMASVGRGDTVDVVLPAHYLYPCSYEQRGMAQDVWRKPHSLAAHHWEGSWLGRSGFINGKVS